MTIVETCAPESRLIAGLSELRGRSKSREATRRIHGKIRFTSRITSQTRQRTGR